jgi:hypothetical protein
MAALERAAEETFEHAPWHTDVLRKLLSDLDDDDLVDAADELAAYLEIDRDEAAAIVQRLRSSPAPESEVERRAAWWLVRDRM